MSEPIKRCWAEINIDNAKHNFNLIKEEAKGRKIFAVVKADCYGHGAAVLAPLYDQWGADAFAVSNIEEAAELRKLKIKKPILILGYTPAENADLLMKYDISQAAYSTEYIKALADCAKKANSKIKIQIKIDVGMGRLGFDMRSEAAVKTSVAEVKSAIDNTLLTVEGIFTHFPVADGNDAQRAETENMYHHFSSAVNEFKSNGIEPDFIHCSNSAFLIWHNPIIDNAVRPGVTMYGMKPDPDMNFDNKFKPLMSLKAAVSFVKTIKAGDTVSYGRTFKADKDTDVATIPVGYADGYPRLQSNKGYVIINGKKAPIIGRVCMDQLMVDVTEIPVKMGDEATVMSDGTDEAETAEDIAKATSTINYEITCGISKRIPRVYTKNGENIKVESFYMNKYNY